MSQPGDFIARLRERQVIKTFVLYVAIGWGFYEIASEILARFPPESAPGARPADAPE